MELVANSVLSLFETDKKQRKIFIDEVVSMVWEGNCNVLQVHARVKMMEEVVKGILASKEYKQGLLDEAQKHGYSVFTVGNAQYQIAELGMSYDYDSCNDSVLRELEKQLDELERKVDERKEFLRSLPSKGIVAVNEETGEVERVLPPIKTSTTGVKVKLL